ncbi:MAG: hypothetical protein IPI73_17550 [Betaproteobacteria bacterium]|nr:hypothetical protein [Betaproteobacteria bacterium]
MRTADVGLSVDTAVDVAKDAADIMLLRNDLDIAARRRPTKAGARSATSASTF